MVKPDPVGDREVVIALVTPIGGPSQAVVDALHVAFDGYGYVVEDVRISTLLDRAIGLGTQAASEVEQLMDKGDKFREILDYDAACAHLAVLAIRRRRRKSTGSSDQHRPRHVNLVRSLKTPGEVRLLRKVYGQRLIVIGVGSSREQRRRVLEERLERERVKEPEAEASKLLRRDEKDEETALGQRSSKAYEMCDAYIPVPRPGRTPEVERFVELLLGKPFQTPLRDEQAMFYAWAAKYRSSAAGRQVGASIVDAHGEIVAVGCNDVPRPLGGQYWPDHEEDRRDSALGRDANDHGKFGVARDVLDRLAEAGWLSANVGGEDVASMDPEARVEAALADGGPMSASQLADIIEFGRIVHAEMAALTTAAREGRAVDGCTLYTTTYPCHECARLIIAAGIARVVYIDPYSKSRVSQLFSEMMDESGRPERVLIEPFSGVSPRLFARVFGMSNRTKGLTGVYDAWDKDRQRLVVLDEEFVDTIPLNELQASNWLTNSLVRLQQDGDLDVVDLKMSAL